MAEKLELRSDVRPPKSKLVHNHTNDVEGVYPFPIELTRRAVRATGAGFAGTMIRHEVFQAGLVPIIERVVRDVSANFGTIREELPCGTCDRACGLLEQNRPQAGPGTRTGFLNLFISAGVDRARFEEQERPDQPMLVTHVRCFSALEPQTSDNYDTYARAQVEKLPDGLQFDERCHLVMGEVAVATFASFEKRIVKLEAARL